MKVAIKHYPYSFTGFKESVLKSCHILLFVLTGHLSFAQDIVDPFAESPDTSFNLILEEQVRFLDSISAISTVDSMTPIDSLADSDSTKTQDATINAFDIGGEDVIKPTVTSISTYTTAMGPELRLGVYVPEPVYIKLLISDLTGGEYKSETFKAIEGRHQYNFNIKGMPAGWYQVKLTGDAYMIRRNFQVRAQ